jgi:hypothetical protein
MGVTQPEPTAIGWLTGDNQTNYFSAPHSVYKCLSLNENLFKKIKRPYIL